MRKTICLGDMATYINGYAFKPVDWGTKGLPIIRIQNLTDSGKDYNYYDGEIKEKYLVKKGDVLISWSASIGVFEWEKEDAWLNQHIFKVVFDKKEVNKQYFKYVTSYVLKKSLQYAHGSTMKHLTKSTFDKLPIPIYDLNVQRVIAEKIGKVDEAIAECDAMLADFDLLVKSRFIEMFGDIHKNPMGWRQSTVGEECYYIKDGPHKSPSYVTEETGVPFISTRNIVNGFGIDWSTAKYISEEDYQQCIKKCHPHKGDILYSKGGTTGIAKLVDTDRKFANWVHVAVLKFHDNLDGRFFESMLNTDYCYAQSQRLTKGVANRDFVLSAIAQVKIFIPPIELQRQYKSFVEQTNKSKLIIQKSLDDLQELRDSLLQEYFG